MQNDQIDLYLGNYDYYREKLREASLTDEERQVVSKTQIKKERKKEKLKKSEIKAKKNKIRDIEKEMKETDLLIKDLTKESLAEGFYNDQDRVAQVFKEIKDLEEKRDDLDEVWLDLNLELEEDD